MSEFVEATERLETLRPAVSLFGSARLKPEDPYYKQAEVIARNIDTVGLPGASVRRGAVAAVLAAGAPTPVDLVLADPPYDVTTDNIQAVLTALPDGKWVRPGSVVVIERPVSAPELVWPDDWTPWPPRRYGDTRLEAAEFG
jgi:16S rRNA G966 N2-methylase RsmD